MYTPERWPFVEIRFKGITPVQWYAMRAFVEEAAESNPAAAMLAAAMLDAEESHREIEQILEQANARASLPLSDEEEEFARDMVDALRDRDEPAPTAE